MTYSIFQVFGGTTAETYIHTYTLPLESSSLQVAAVADPKRPGWYAAAQSDHNFVLCHIWVFISYQSKLYGSL